MHFKLQIQSIQYVRHLMFSSMFFTSIVLSCPAVDALVRHIPSVCRLTQTTTTPIDSSLQRRRFSLTIRFDCLSIPVWIIGKSRNCKIVIYVFPTPSAPQNARDNKYEEKKTLDQSPRTCHLSSEHINMDWVRLADVVDRPRAHHTQNARNFQKSSQQLPNRPS